MFDVWTSLSGRRFQPSQAWARKRGERLLGGNDPGVALVATELILNVWYPEHYELEVIVVKTGRHAG